MGKTIRSRFILTVVTAFMFNGCVTVEDFDFENYETAKAKSILFTKPIVDKQKETAVVAPERIIAKVQKAKLQRAIQSVSQPRENINRKEAFKDGNFKLYTPEIVVDQKEDSPSQKKGAALLVWSKKMPDTNYEVEIFQGTKVDLKNLFFAQSHFLHIMIYFNKDYFWRVRMLDAQRLPLSEYSPLKALKVIRKEGSQRAISSQTSKRE